MSVRVEVKLRRGQTARGLRALAEEEGLMVIAPPDELSAEIVVYTVDADPAYVEQWFSMYSGGATIRSNGPVEPSEFP